MRRLGLVLLLALAFPAGAFAHASLIQTQPSFRQRLQTSPRMVALSFDQGVKAFPDSVVVYTATGRVVSGAARNRADPHYVEVPVRKLGRGPYTVRWHALSSDGHVVSGVFTFGVRYDAPEPTGGYGASGATRFGEAFIAMTLGFALVSAFLFLAWLTDRRWLLWPAFLLGLGFASGLALSGHSAVDAGASKWSELADWVHLSAAALWVGGLVQLVVVVWPADGERRREAFLCFARTAPVLIALLLAAGIYLSVLRLPHLHDLWAAGYGRVLLVKLSLVSVALAWGGFHHVVVRPMLDRAGVVRRLPRSLAGESAVGMAILLVAAVLVDSKPPPQPAPPPPQAASVRP